MTKLHLTTGERACLVHALTRMLDEKQGVKQQRYIIDLANKLRNLEFPTT